ncbi:uncharacterized protein BDR25DRAFT_327017 [Lindgomyces ingoldianus]|uniref:Uncharacterized protein n=1 Tax=Lindgomyces ingoldianus TaxID=673940 RepID=A0ACB6QMQ7_9PLEO|nr:uncharacterized protein BDR25DRAFT_327017 [Lindgomyces ingoldianus]KAF2468264.1 hypothetical protein BDR25DRAFT_327017 [Lindgomyces ingoldianus]
MGFGIPRYVMKLKGVIIKWSILAGIFFFFMAWFVGGYIHAKRRMRKGKPLMGYHRWLVPYSERKRFGQTPQNHFTFYAPQQPYGQRPDGTYPEPPPMYNNNDAPPGYMPPPGATKTHPAQNYEMMPEYAPQQYGSTGAYPMGGQQNGVVRPHGDVEQQHQSPELPPRPQQAKLAVTNFISRFRR